MTNLGKVFLDGISKFPYASVQVINVDSIIEQYKTPIISRGNNDYIIAKPNGLVRRVLPLSEQNFMIPSCCYTGSDSESRQIKKIIDEVNLLEILEHYPCDKHVKYLGGYVPTCSTDVSNISKEVIRQISESPAHTTMLYCSPKYIVDMNELIETIDYNFRPFYGKSKANIIISGQMSMYYGYSAYVYTGSIKSDVQFLDWALHLLRNMKDAIPDIHMDINPLYPFMKYIRFYVNEVIDEDGDYYDANVDGICDALEQEYFGDSEYCRPYEDKYVAIPTYINHLRHSFGIESEIKAYSDFDMVPDFDTLIINAYKLLGYNCIRFHEHKNPYVGFDEMYRTIRNIDRMLADYVD